MTRPRLALVVGAGFAVCAALIPIVYGFGLGLRHLWTPSTPLLFIPIVAVVSSFGTGGLRPRDRVGAAASAGALTHGRQTCGGVRGLPPG